MTSLWMNLPKPETNWNCWKNKNAKHLCNIHDRPTPQAHYTHPYQPSSCYSSLSGNLSGPAYAHQYTKQALASVTSLERRNYEVTGSLDHYRNRSWSTSLVLAHVKRSRECPLNVRIRYWLFRNHFPKFSGLLGLMVSYGYRWRSFLVKNNSQDMDGGVIKSIWNVSFSSLKVPNYSSILILRKA
ncbi:hypothetical protein F5J12DRAFT_542085 [Pisolithus orientalis]|uniref:uncharacterized protein n=1 Tax=Pisolithus orientalis TaxID=936130 RepID=UPI0022254FA9|nr:uncharacterized protein F5J12DRAFT_542085 [Pisolithus orientalis]KAI6012609.1 hypothetical protein F5J12DRAFT_542085 [Pisolithus orientalis]